MIVAVVALLAALRGTAAASVTHASGAAPLTLAFASPSLERKRSFSRSSFEACMAEDPSVATDSSSETAAAESAAPKSSSSEEGKLSASRLLLGLSQLSSAEKRLLLADIGRHHSLLGALGSMTTSLLAHPTRVRNMLYEGYGALYSYLRGSEIWPDIEGIANSRYLENRALLGVLQMAKLGHGDRRDESAFKEGELSLEELTGMFPMEEAKRYVKFAVAAYGDAAMQASKLDVYQEVDLRVGDITKKRVSEHIGIPEDDLVVFDVAHDGTPDVLRHFVALDRQNEKVVLAIRGTWTHQEVMVDVNGYSRPFYGGEAHVGISLVSERLWEILSDTILSLLDEHPTYELIITGHSLGGGATTCLNVVLHYDPRMKGHKFRSFAWASPPVFTPTTYASKPEILDTAVNYVHRYDDVPFLSGDTIRRQIEAVAAVDAATKDMSLLRKAKLVTGVENPPEHLVEEVHRVQRTPVKKKEGMPAGIIVPVKANVWFWESSDRPGKYDAKLCDSLKMVEGGVFVHSDSLADHLPARYEYVMMNLVADKE